MPISLLGLSKLGFVELKPEGLARDLLILLRQLKFHESEGPTRFALGRADTHQQGIPRRTTPPHSTELPQEPRQSLAPHRHLLRLPPFTLGQHIQLATLRE